MVLDEALKVIESRKRKVLPNSSFLRMLVQLLREETLSFCGTCMRKRLLVDKSHVQGRDIYKVFAKFGFTSGGSF